jgi:sterol-4alpha-carboxylate 3-dehydrogenase (decarboxylating)
MAPIPSTAKKDLGNVVVIGGCGFLGHHIVNQLVESYTCKVSVMDLRTTRNRRPESDGVQYFDGDITSLDSLRTIFKKVKPDVVIHTASPVAIAEMANSFLHKVNVEGTKCVIDVCRETGVTALVYTSSASVISDSVTDLINADERWPILKGKAQLDYYAETKGLAEEAILAANRSGPSNLLTVAIRPAGIFGEGDVQLLPNMLDLYYTNKTNFQVGDNTNLFDFTYVGNVAHAHLLAAHLLLSTSKLSTTPLDHEKVDGEAFIITNDAPIYFWDFPRQLWAIAGNTKGTEGVWTITKGVGVPLATVAETALWLIGKKSKLTPRGIRFSCMTRYYNIGKAKERLGYKPIVSTREGMERSVKAFIAEKESEKDKKTQ